MKKWSITPSVSIYSMVYLSFLSIYCLRFNQSRQSSADCDQYFINPSSKHFFQDKNKKARWYHNLYSMRKIEGNVLTFLAYTIW